MKLQSILVEKRYKLGYWLSDQNSGLDQNIKRYKKKGW